MSWVCDYCSSSNEDTNKKCFVCGHNKPIVRKNIEEKKKIKDTSIITEKKIKDTSIITEKKITEEKKIPETESVASFNLKNSMTKWVRIFLIVIVACIVIGLILQMFRIGDNNKSTNVTTNETNNETTLVDSKEENTTEEEFTDYFDVDESTAINVYSWNSELGDRLNYFYEEYPEYKSLVNYVNLGLGGTSDEYKTAIESAINSGGENYPSIIACDNDVALYFLKSDYIIPISKVNISPDDYSEAYNYTVDYATINGELKGVTWQACPGCFVYRNDIAREVLGSSDPENVQAAIDDWGKFFVTADKMKEAGYKMLSGPDDVKYVFLDQRSSPWVENDKLNIDQAVYDYLETSKKLYDGGYTDKTSMWSDAWTANLSDGKVFGYFGCTWWVYWCVPYQSEGSGNGGFYGNCSIVNGPSSYHWGGTYLCVTADCPNKGLAGLILYTMTCNTEIMQKLSEETLDFVNNKRAIQNQIDSGTGASEVLAGQNPLTVWAESAEKISLKNATEYDSTINGFMDIASSAYNSGEVNDIGSAVDIIKDSVRNTYSYILVE